MQAHAKAGGPRCLGCGSVLPCTILAQCMGRQPRHCKLPLPAARGGRRWDLFAGRSSLTIPLAQRHALFDVRKLKEAHVHKEVEQSQEAVQVLIPQPLLAGRRQQLSCRLRRSCWL